VLVFPEPAPAMIRSGADGMAASPTPCSTARHCSELSLATEAKGIKVKPGGRKQKANQPRFAFCSQWGLTRASVTRLGRIRAAAAARKLPDGALFPFRATNRAILPFLWRDPDKWAEDICPVCPVRTGVTFSL
jgi:hypothetical protein